MLRMDGSAPAPLPARRAVDGRSLACETSDAVMEPVWSTRVMDASGLTASLRDAFARSSLLSSDALRDDERVRKAAKVAYDSLPMSLRLAVRFSVGEAGFEKFVFSVRDLMLSHQVSDLSQLAGSQFLDLASRFFSGRAQPGGESQLQSEAVLQVAPKAPAPVAAPAPVSAPPPNEWHIRRGGDHYGPFSSSEFLQLAEDRRLMPSDLVWRTGLEGWIMLADLPRQCLATA